MISVGMRCDHVVDVRNTQRLRQVRIYQTAVRAFAAVDHHDLIATLKNRSVSLPDIQKVNQ